MKSPVVNKSLDLRLWAKLSRDALKWSLLHVAVLGVLIYDVSKKCKYADSKLYYIEYFAMLIVGSSLFYYVCRYLYFSFIWEPVVGTVEQKRLLQFDNDASFVVRKESPKVPGTRVNTNNAALNFSNLSCSFNDSHMSGYSSPGRNQSMHINHSLNYSSANNTKPQSAFSSPYLGVTTDNDLFMEAASLNNLMEDASYQELMNGEEEIASTMNNMTTFWAHKVDDYAGLLKTAKYQMSPTTTNDAKPTNQIIDDCGFFVCNSAMNKSSDKILENSRLSSAKLSHCVTNLKRWISATVVDRVAHEIISIDNAFKSKGFGDLQIGHVGLDRLKKTTENPLVTRNIPTLSLLVPFLELTSNQEYLVNRIKELSKGSCLTEFKYAANQIAAVSWDEHLPTDAAVIFHLFCTYLDMQMLPLPQPGGRPFYDRYVIVGDKKSHSELMAEVKNKAKCAILVSNPLKPVFHFANANKINDSVPDRNNLFHVITQFLFYIKTEHGGYLENVNLDKSGLNILCILEG